MKKLLVIIVLISIGSSVKLLAQDKGYLSFQYSMGFGNGDMSDYISKPSFRGITFEYHKNVNSVVSAGLETSWNYFYERKDYDTYTSNSMSLSGIQYRYSHSIPILLAVESNLKQVNNIRVIANFGVGTMYTSRTTDMGIWSLKEDAWQFAIKPELGVIINVAPKVNFKLAGKYYMGFKSDSMESQSYFAINAGLALDM
jgi:hypothetical protein